MEAEEGKRVRVSFICKLEEDIFNRWARKLIIRKSP